MGSNRLKGNKFWELRSKHGKDKLFSDPVALWEEAKLYWDWCDRSPWMRPELVKYQGSADEYEVPLGRPYSLDGLTIYLGVSGAYFRAAKINLKTKIEEGKATTVEEALLETIEMIETVTRTQNLEGAAVNVFNANIMARIHTLAETINQNSTGDAVVRVTVRDQETADNLNLLNEALK